MTLNAINELATRSIQKAQKMSNPGNDEKKPLKNFLLIFINTLVVQKSMHFSKIVLCQCASLN